MIRNIIFDFDSSIVTVKSVEFLLKTAIQQSGKERSVRLERLYELNGQIMEGKRLVGDALSCVLELAPLNLADVERAAEQMIRYVRPRVRETITDLLAREKKLFVFSVGIDKMVVPLARRLGIPANNIFTNNLRFNQKGRVTGFDDSNPLFSNVGKLYLAEKLSKAGRLDGGTAVVGDSLADLAICKNKIGDMFVYFAGPTVWEDTRRQADFSVDRFDRLLPLFCSDDELSHDKAGALVSGDEPETKKPSILLLENVHHRAEEKLREAGYDVALEKSAWEEEKLCRSVHVNVLGIRSRTRLSRRAIMEMKQLWVIGAFCIGTNQIDLVAATEAGIPVFNAPYANTRSVAELVVGEVIMLMRRTFEKSSAAHQGRWLKSAHGAREIRGKTVGIVGYGRIGSQVSVLLENMGMSVLYFDIVDKLPLGNAKAVDTLQEVLENADIVTLHVPDTPITQGLIGKKELSMMKCGVCLINASRGKVVDLEALRQSMDSGHIAGAALDVFPEEPARAEDIFHTPMQGAPNVILTPHIGGSTLEAQENIAEYISSKFEKFIRTGSTIGSVNLPEMELPRIQGTHRILHVHRNVPGVLAKINSVFARRNINVEGQILQTKGSIGYLIVDVDQDVADQVLNLLTAVTETIKVRKIE